MGTAVRVGIVLGSDSDLPVMLDMDALLSIVQMPPGVPVATVAIGTWGARNAAILAAQLLAGADPALRERLAAYRTRLADELEDRARRMADQLRTRS